MSVHSVCVLLRTVCPASYTPELEVRTVVVVAFRPPVENNKKKIVVISAHNFK